MEEYNHKITEDTNIQLNDIGFKNLVLKHSKIAQNQGIGFLTTLKTYEMYHEPLKKFFIDKYGKSPTKCDNLTFILLLTYPEKKINEFTSVEDLKLAFNNSSAVSDFDSKGWRC